MFTFYLKFLHHHQFSYSYLIKLSFVHEKEYIPMLTELFLSYNVFPVIVVKKRAVIFFSEFQLAALQLFFFSFLIIFTGSFFFQIRSLIFAYIPKQHIQTRNVQLPVISNDCFI